MKEIRLAQTGEILRQKEIWKLCFGDPDQFIDFFYAERYREQETMLLLDNQVIVSMLTMIPIKLVMPEQRSLDGTMLYAIATHPQYQHRGFAAQLIDFANQYLYKRGSLFTALVPSGAELFEFYRQQGYQNTFYTQETVSTRIMIDNLLVAENLSGKITVTSPQEYNQRRNKTLNGSLYVSYDDQEAAYQAKLSQLSGADIYGIEIEAVQGCAAIERISAARVIIKELLMPEPYYLLAIKLIAELLPAQEYIIRTPGSSAQQPGSSRKPFGMSKALSDVDLTNVTGYLGLAFD